MDIGKVVKVHPKREVPAQEPAKRSDYEIVSVPVRPSERAARRRKLWEGPQSVPEKQPVHVPVRRKETT